MLIIFDRMGIYFMLQFIIVKFLTILYNNITLFHGMNINTFKDLDSYNIKTSSPLQHDSNKSENKLYTQFMYRLMFLGKYQMFPSFSITINFSDFSNFFEFSMIRGFFKTASKVGNNTTYVTPQIGKAGYVTYRVDDAKPGITTYEQSQENPLLERNNGTTFQHPPIVRTTCGIPNCEHKLCKQLCETPIQHADVGHTTHGESYPGTKFVSNVDCSGKQHAEYILPYVPPVENTTMSSNTNQVKTTNLNNNEEALNNVHMNSSRLPVKKTSTGSNDNTNIN